MNTTRTDDETNIAADATSFAARVFANQRRLASSVRQTYDFIVCGSGSSGSVVARRIAENPDVTVLLLEAGGIDDVPAVMEAARWPENLGSERDWAFKPRPNPHLNGRSLIWSMGKVLGGSSSINVMVWARGHKNDWNDFAAETGDDGWGYDSILEIYRRIEDWHGEPDSARRGKGGLVFVQPPENPNPAATTLLDAARSVGIPTFADQNGALMEGGGGAALSNLRVRDGKRLSVFRTYVYPYMDRPNLTVLTHASVRKVILQNKTAIGVDVEIDGAHARFNAGREVILSLGAIQTPKVLMQSGIGDANDLQPLGIDVVQHLPGVGQNLQEHLLFGGCAWEADATMEWPCTHADATFFWKSDSALDTPDLQSFFLDGPFLSAELIHLNTAKACWTIAPGVVRPHSRGRVRLTGSNPRDPLDIDANLLSDSADMKAATACVRLCRNIGNSPAYRALGSREIIPGNLHCAALEDFIRNAAVPFWHYACTAKMGRDEMSVVDGSLKVYGVDRLRIADGSVMPKITTGNTMAPCVVIGERAGDFIRRSHGL